MNTEQKFLKSVRRVDRATKYFRMVENFMTKVANKIKDELDMLQKLKEEMFQESELRIYEARELQKLNAQRATIAIKATKYRLKDVERFL